MLNSSDEDILARVGIRLVDALQSRGILVRHTDIGRYQMKIYEGAEAVLVIDTTNGNVKRLTASELRRV